MKEPATFHVGPCCSTRLPATSTKRPGTPEHATPPADLYRSAVKRSRAMDANDDATAVNAHSGKSMTNEERVQRIRLISSTLRDMGLRFGVIGKCGKRFRSLN